MKSIKALIITKLALVLAIPVDHEEANIQTFIGINLASKDVSRKASNPNCCISPFRVELKETHKHKVVDVNFAKKIPNADEPYTCGEYECSTAWVSWSDRLEHLCEDFDGGCTDDLCCIGPKCTTHECSEGMEQYNDNKGVRLGDTDECCCQKRGTSTPAVDPPACIAPTSGVGAGDGDNSTSGVGAGDGGNSTSSEAPPAPPSVPPSAPPSVPPSKYGSHANVTSLLGLMDNCTGNASFVSSDFGGCTQTYQTSLLQNFVKLFYGGSSTYAGIDMNGWNTAAVTDMSSMFYKADAFSQEVNGWNTAAVKNMNRMFYYAGLFAQEVNGWNTAAVTDMSWLFYYGSAFNSEINGWNTAAVKNMNEMFAYAGYAGSFLQEVDGWNTAAATDMSKMFAGCDYFNQTLTAWNTAAVTDMSKMFMMDSVFNGEINGWNTAAVKNMNGMFMYVGQYNSELNGWNTAAVTDMGRMFEGNQLGYTTNDKKKSATADWNFASISGSKPY